MGAKKVAGEEYLVFPQIREHCLRPVYPGGVDKLQSLVPQRQSLAIVYGDKPVLRDKQESNEQILSFGCGHHLGFGILRQNTGDAARVVLLGMVGNDIVDDRNILKIGHEDVSHRGIRSIYQSNFLAALHQIGVIACTIRKGYQGVKESPAPVNSAYPVNICLYFSRFHSPPSFQKSFFSFNLLYFSDVLGG